MRPAVFRASGPLKCGKNFFPRDNRITAMTGRDWHKDDGLPCCYTWVGCEGELTVPKLLDAIRGGHICLSAGPLLTMEAEIPGETGSGKEAISCGETFPAATEELTLHLNLQEEILPGIWDRTQVKSGEIRVIADGKVIACVPVEKNGTLQTRTPPGESTGKMAAGGSVRQLLRAGRLPDRADKSGVPDGRAGL